MLLDWLMSSSPWSFIVLFPLLGAAIFGGIYVITSLEQSRRERWESSSLRRAAVDLGNGKVSLVVTVLALLGGDAELPWDAVSRTLRATVAEEEVLIALGAVGQGCEDLIPGATISITVRPCCEGAYWHSPIYGLHATSFRILREGQ